jgi:protein subunit release factor B
MAINFGVTEQKANELRARMSACGLQESDLVESFVRSQGPGGQKVNRSSTCVYLKHLPTGLEVKMQETRSQLQNRFFARRRMCELLESRQLGAASPESLKQEKIRKQKARRRRRSRSSSS